MKRKILVGMSGGVDSSVAAAICKAEGHDVTGITMKVWDGDPCCCESVSKHACYGPGEENDIEDARKVAGLLDIPFLVIDLAKEYKDYVIEYFRNEYKEGRTPNPCVRCNHKVKFGYLLEKARNLGYEFDCFATGHYVIKYYHENNKRFGIRKAVDLKKDQSYFLSYLNQSQLSISHFPLGGLMKNEVRKMADKFKLPVKEKQESQDFIENGDYSLLFDHPPEPGPFIDTEGKILGYHKGIIHYTIGQRKGIGIANREPLYVLSINKKNNSITIGEKHKLFMEGLIASNINWISTDGLKDRIKAKARIRLTHKEAEAEIIPVENEMIKVLFDDPQIGITPGQIVVFYDEDRVIGGGMIERSIKHQLD